MATALATRLGLGAAAAPCALARSFSARAARGNNLVFLGAPGVGKGTFANKIAPKLGVPAISTGDIIRAEIKAGTELGKKVKEYANAGKLVPDEIVSAMVRERLKKPDAQNGWILVSWCGGGGGREPVVSKGGRGGGRWMQTNPSPSAPGKIRDCPDGATA
jgi:hypothetical protein